MLGDVIDFLEAVPSGITISKPYIVMGTHGKGIVSQAFFGSVAKRVLRRVRKPVFVIPLPEE